MESGRSLFDSIDPGYVEEPEEREIETVPVVEVASTAPTETRSTVSILKQTTMFAPETTGPTKYTTAAGSPLYVPKDRRPHIGELVNNSKVIALTREIAKSNASEEEKAFLLAAAARHAVFNYELIADYYAHASPEMQRLMESSALVIVDIDQAIEKGYVRLCENIRKAYLEEVAANA